MREAPLPPTESQGPEARGVVLPRAPAQAEKEQSDLQLAGGQAGLQSLGVQPLALPADLGVERKWSCLAFLEAPTWWTLTPLC